MTPRTTPPRLARLLLRRLLAQENRDYIIGDLDEEFAVHRTSAGRVAAWRWYWSQAIRSIVQGPAARPLPHEQPALEGTFASTLRDFRFSFRNLSRSPGFTGAALLTLGLGIGASVAIFSAVNEVMLRPLSFPQPDRLAMLWESNTERGWQKVHAAPANVADWRERTSSFVDVGFVSDFTSAVTLGGGNEPVQVVMSTVSGNAFSILGAKAQLGRIFRDDETYDSGIAVLSHDAWRRYFGSDPAIVGRTVRLDGQTHEVIGVLGPRFRYAINDAEVWVPSSWMAGRRESVWFRQAHVIRPIARLKHGVTFEQAAADLATVAGQLEREYPDTNRGMEAGLTPLHDHLVGDRRGVLLLLLGAVVLLQLIACANVANLLLGRAVDRRHEMSVRAALGAGRARLVRQVLTESLVLAIGGTALGLAMGVAGLRAIASISPPELEGLVFRLDWRLGLVTITVCALSAALFGILPAWRGSRVDGITTNSSRTRTMSPRRLLAANGFVSFEVGLAVVLVAAAGLMVRSVDQLRRVDPGVDTANVLTFRVHPPSGTYPDDSDRAAFVDAFVEQLEAVPGVVAAGAARGLPLTGYAWTSDFAIQGWSTDRSGTELRHREAMPGYFEALGVQAVEGRIFPQRLGPDEPVPVVVNQAFADEYFPGDSPVGRRIAFDREPTAESYWYPIVGVVQNERMSLTMDPVPEVISHLRGDTPATFSFAVKTAAPPLSLVGDVRDALARTDAEVPLLRVRTMDDVVADARAADRFLMTLLSVFGVAALLLASVGVYGVANQAARARTREVGIRMALGAPPRRIVVGLLARGTVFVLAGIGVGVLGTFAAGRTMAGLLYAVDPRDPLTLFVVVVIMGLVACVSSVWPAWRATRTDPVRVLRAE